MMRAHLVAGVAAAAAAALTSCAFAARAPADAALVSCAGDGDCADGWTCASSRQCLPPGIAPPALTWEITPTPLLEGETATLVPSTNAGPAAELVIVRQPARATFVDDDGDALCPDDDGAPCVLAPAPAALSLRVDDDAGDDDAFTALVRRTDVHDLTGAPLASAPGEVPLDVEPVNDAPALTDRALALDEDTALVVLLGGDDVDDDPATLTYALQVPPAHGAAALVDDDGNVDPAGRSLRYVPLADFHGEDEIVVRVSDAAGAFADATLGLSVAPVPDAPVALSPPDPVALDEDTLRVVALPAFDVDDVAGDGSTGLTWRIAVQPQHARELLDDATFDTNSGVIVYRPADDYHGNDSVGFVVVDDTGRESAIAFVSFVVAPQPDAPTVTSAIRMLAVGANQGFNVETADADGDAVTVEIVTAPASAEAVLVGNTKLELSPLAHVTQTSDFITLRARDASNLTTDSTIPIVIEGAASCAVVAAIARRDDASGGGIGARLTSGPFLIGNPAYPAHCDLDRHGGGYEVVLKVTGASNVFADETRLRDETLVNAGNIGLDRADAKLEGALRTVVDDLLVVNLPDAALAPANAIVTAVPRGGGGDVTLVQLFNAPTALALPGWSFDDWVRLLDVTPLGCTVTSSAAGVLGVPVLGARRGYTCTTGLGDVVGVGLQQLSAGAEIAAVFDQGPPDFVPRSLAVLVRSRDFTSLPSQPSCQDHRDFNGATLTGRYLVDGAGVVECALGEPAAGCGDGVLQSGEDCDDANDVALDGCFTCRSQECGNGVVEPGEGCDNIVGPLPPGCNLATCTIDT